MPVDIINVPALHAAVEAALAAAPDVLRPHAPGLRAALRRVAAQHCSVRPAHRRRADPGWAQTGFDAGRPLHRFAEREAAALTEDLGDLVALLAQVARIAGPGAAEAAAFLRGLPHRRYDLSDLTEAAETVLDRARTLRLLAGRHALVRAPAEVGADGLVAIRCRSLDAVIRLGREARNCLADLERYWQRFDHGDLDLWAVREADTLVAVLAVAGTRVREAFGPGNAVVPLDRVQAVARVCARAGWTVHDGCEGLLPEYVGPILVGPLRLTVDDRVVAYAEWADAVRIDMSGGADDGADGEVAFLMDMLDGIRRPRTLALASDPVQPCADAILYGPDPRPAVAAFGIDRLRSVVAGVALGRAVPTVVQHRLMALAA